MNSPWGSAGEFVKYNGVWQDGGIIIYFPDENRFAAIFLAFASQAVHTDEVKGNALSGSQNFAQLLNFAPERIGGEEEEQEERIADDLRVAIIAALVNPVGSENQENGNVEPEVVYLLNRSTRDVSIKNWSLLNADDVALTISDEATLASGEMRKIIMKVSLQSRRANFSTGRAR